MSSQLSKNLPKRAAKDHKSHIKRARSWAKNQAAKLIRKAEQKKREEYNREVGSTGKQRRYNKRFK